MEEKNEKIVRFSISLPDELLKIMDNNFINQGYASRSEFIRDLIREKIVSEKWDNPNQKIIGVISIIYNHHLSDLSEKMIHIQHNNLINVLCNLHMHVNQEDCLEVIVLKGSAKEIQKINLEISGIKGIKFSELTKLILPEK